MTPFRCKNRFQRAYAYLAGIAALSAWNLQANLREKLIGWVKKNHLEW